MKVRSLTLENVMSHQATTVELPERGVVVVTGNNGAGKSALVEGVALAVWGRTLRGSTGWSIGADKHRVVLDADGVSVTRTRSGAKNALTWNRAGESAEKFTTPTKAQEVLEKEIGTLDVWRRSCAFSSSDAAHFSTATDAERKRLLETVIGLDRFDEALEACRTDARAADQAHAAAQMAAVRASDALEGARRQLAEAEGMLAKLDAEAPPAPTAAEAAPPDGEVAALFRSLSRLETDAGTLRADLRAAERKAGGIASRQADAERYLSRLEGGKVCPTCARPLPCDEKAIADARGAAERAKADAAKAAADAASEISGLEITLQELEEDVAAVRKERDEKRAKVVLAAERAGARARWQAARDQSSGLVERWRTALDEREKAFETANAEVKRKRRDLETLRAVESVLGLRGVRAHVLGKALAGLESVANAWLMRLGRRDLTVKLQPYSERKNGNIADAISLSVVVEDGDDGYKAASAGERRRIDIAFLLALSGIAEAAFARGGSTLFFDEVFDGLDEDGRMHVASMLSELAEDRAVVVITHNTKLAEALPAVLRLQVEDGRVARG